MTRLLGGIRPSVVIAAAAMLAGTGWAQNPDLTIKNIDTSGVTGDWQTLAIGGSMQVDVDNIGAGAAGGFDVVCFEDTNGNGAYDPGPDQMLGLGSSAGAAAGATSSVTVAVSGTVVFRDDLIFATADPAGVITEDDETNNTSNSGLFCLIQPPPPGAINPVLEWSWTSSLVEPNALNVMMTPVVIDLTNDGIPDVVFAATASTGGGSVEIGFLRALNGDDGTEIFTVNDPALRVNTAFNIAAGDIDGDNRPEILAGSIANNTVFCFEHDGTLKWTSAAVSPLSWGAAAIADIDQDGTPEILLGRQALDASGNLLWTGTGGFGSSLGPMSYAADVDLDGVPEIVSGNTVYENDGSTLWQAPVGDGSTALANFDADNFPEIVLVSGGAVRLLSGESGAVQWGPVGIPGGGIGGPPTVADYDADGMPEIGVAGASRYTVFETDGSVKWAAVVQDSSSNRTGSSVFDFNGDGSAEVVYRDELKLRIFKGTDGTVLWEVPMSSCTWHEYVQVSDVDADGNAEIVAMANNNCGFGPQRGVFIYGADDDSWVPTRQIWNQHTYHITNVNDDGTIPQVEQNNWLFPPASPLNNFRQNTLSGGQSALSAPDISSCWIRAASGSITARIGNGGAVLVGTGIPVSFYDGDPAGAGNLLGTTATSIPLKPGDFEDVTLAVGTVPGTVWVAADDSGGLVSTENECDETNNIHSQAVTAPFFTSPVCGQTIAASVGVPVTYAISAEDPDSGDVVTLDATGVPAGATHSPGLPLMGNPVSTSFDWTPQNNQVGTHVVTYTATDGLDTVQCQVTIVVAECHLVVASNRGTQKWSIGGYQYQTQLQGIFTSWPVLMDDIPVFRLPTFPTKGKQTVKNLTPIYDLTLQVVMYNPEVFPGNAEQWTQGLHVRVWSDGSLTTRDFGSGNGMTVTMETYVDKYGNKYVRFPFDIPALTGP